MHRSPRNQPSTPSWHRRFIRSSSLIILVLSFGLAGEFSFVTAQESESAQEVPPSLVKNLEGEFDTRDIAATTAWAESLNLADWLGPMAPLALSPFFGVMLLSGLALWGPEWITDNALLGESGPLCSVPLFCVFAVLTLLTSLPRLTKVSKPLAQAADQLETYAVIVILLAIKVTASYGADGGAESAVALARPDAPLIQLGIVSVTLNGLVMIAMALNMLVINSVRFFFEIMVWLTPLPTVDALFEAANKATCATLMAIYAYSPTLATGLNLLILLAAALVFRWVHRQVRYFRTLMLDPILTRVLGSYGSHPGDQGLIVFLKDAVGGHPKRRRMALRRVADGWTLSPRSGILGIQAVGTAPTVDISGEHDATLKRGWFSHVVTLQSDVESDDGAKAAIEIVVSRRYDADLETIARDYNVTVDDAEVGRARVARPGAESMSEVRAEMA
ncbi:MAG: hypothetical protein AAGD07_01585 [Planctomycetota bacterium]